MRSLLTSLAAVGVAILLGAAPAAAQSSPSLPLTDLTDQTNSDDLQAEALVGGTVAAICSFNPGSTDFKSNVDLTRTYSGRLSILFGFGVRCNFGANYHVKATARFGSLRNISEEAIRDSDIPYDAQFFLFNTSAAHPWTGGTVTLPAIPGAIRATSGTFRPDFTKNGLVYTDRNVPVDPASGRGRVALIGKVTLNENPNSKLSEGGYAWRAGVYAEVFTLTVEPKAPFEIYCNRTTTLNFSGDDHQFKSCGGGGGSGGGYGG